MYNWRTPEYKIVDTREKLVSLSEEIEKTIKKDIPIAIDIETTGCFKSSGLNYYHGWILGCSICFGVEEGYYIPFEHTKDGVRRTKQVTFDDFKEVLGPLLESGGLYLGHNIKFDYKFFAVSGLCLYPRLWDTSIAIQLYNGDAYKPRALKRIIKNFVDVPSDIVQSFESVAHDESSETHPEEMGIYAINDVIFTYYTYLSLKPYIDKYYYDLFYNVEAPLVPILANAELLGIEIDEDYFKSIKEPLEKYTILLDNWVSKKYGISVTSSAQLSNLFSQLGPSHVHLKTTPTGRMSTDDEALKTILKMTNPKDEIYRLAKRVLAHRGNIKLLNTYITKFPEISSKHFEDNREVSVIHTDFDQIKNSGRMSSSPNLQNIPRQSKKTSIRKGFVARKGYKIVAADWSSIELRLVALASKEPKLLDLYKEDPLNADPHLLTAKGLFKKDEITSEERHTGKTINFSLLYGATEFSIAKTLNISKEKAKKLVDNYYKMYPQINKWKKDLERFIAKNRYTETLYGRRRYLNDVISPTMKFDRWKYDGAVRALTNHVIQGTCADIIKRSMVKVVKIFAQEEIDAHLLMSVHDEIVLEARDPERVSEILKSVMEFELNGLLLPIDVEIKDTLEKV